MWIMPKIKAVTADYEEKLPVFGMELIIHLENNDSIFLSLESKANDLAFVILHNDKRLFAVETDGESIYWQDGPRLTFDEIIEMLREDG